MQQLRVTSWLTCGIYATIPCYWMMVHPVAARWRTARSCWTTTPATAMRKTQLEPICAGRKP